MNEFKLQATILFLAYNQQDFVVQAAQSCLDQQGGPFEIIFSDDCSTDATFTLLKTVIGQYKGPHQVVLRQNLSNLGIADHYNTLVKLAKCELLITAAGDDLSYPNRAQTLCDTWRASDSKLDLIASYAQSITYEGHKTEKLIKVDQLSRWKSAADWCAKRPYVVGATHAFTKRIWIKFGDIASDVSYEDQIITLRAMCLGGGITISQPMLDYRMGGISARLKTSDSQEKYSHFFKRYIRQRAVFMQVQSDLINAGHVQLWKGKVKRYLNRSFAALWLLENKFILNNFKIILKIFFDCGIFWTFRQIYILKFKLQK